MSIKKKKVIKIKKKNMFILLIIMFLTFFITTKSVQLIITQLNNIEKTVSKKEDNNKKKKKKEGNNINNPDYYNEKYQDRYQKYQEKNKNLSYEQVIKEVNMNLDLTPYENAKEAKQQNTEKVLVNKYYYLSEDFIPEDLESISKKYALSGMKLKKDAKEAFEKMAKDAEKEDLTIIAMSTYRSYDYQVDLYNRYVKEDGKEKADTYSGRPGFSEHQTGLAVDVYNGEENYTNFEKTAEFKWMQKNAHKYGFILRFPKGKENETKYEYEAWHYRYVGIEIAKYINNNNISFEEYYATKIKDW